MSRLGGKKTLLVLSSSSSFHHMAATAESVRDFVPQRAASHEIGIPGVEPMLPSDPGRLIDRFLDLSEIIGARPDAHVAHKVLTDDHAVEYGIQHTVSAVVEGRSIAVTTAMNTPDQERFQSASAVIGDDQDHTSTWVTMQEGKFNTAQAPKINGQSSDLYANSRSAVEAIEEVAERISFLIEV